MIIDTKLRLSAKKRETKDKPNKMRREGLIPGVIYGPKTKSQPLCFDKEVARIIKKNAGKAQVFPLSIQGEKKEKNIIIQELQYDKVADKLIHIDLYEVDMKKEIETEVPLNFTGTSLAVKDLGGILVKNIEEVLVKCLPADLPEKIDVDISVLKTFEDAIHIKDLQFPEKVEPQADPKSVVAIVSEPRSEKEIEELDQEVQEDISDVEGVEDKAGEEGEGEGEQEKKGEDKAAAEEAKPEQKAGEEKQPAAESAEPKS